MSGPAPVSWARGQPCRNPSDGQRPISAPCAYKQLTHLELLTLSTKLRAGKRRALQAAMRSRSMPEIWEMIRLTNDLTELGEDVNRALARC
jgi:hypothetical protein